MMVLPYLHNFYFNGILDYATLTLGYIKNGVLFLKVLRSNTRLMTCLAANVTVELCEPLDQLMTSRALCCT